MAMKKIKIAIDTQGEVKVEADGVTGPACKQLTADVERALGRVTASQVKPDMHRQQGQGQQAQMGGGFGG